MSRDEFILAALAFWLVAIAAFAFRWRRTALVSAALCAAGMFAAGLRWSRERTGQVLVASNATMHISPHPATSSLGEVPAWSLVRIERRLDNWVLVSGQVSSSGSGAGLSVQGWIPLASVAPIGPLD